MDDDDEVRLFYPLILRVWDAEDENPEQYLEYLEQFNRIGDSSETRRRDA